MMHGNTVKVQWRFIMTLSARTNDICEWMCAELAISDVLPSLHPDFSGTDLTHLDNQYNSIYFHYKTLKNQYIVGNVQCFIMKIYINTSI